MHDHYLIVFTTYPSQDSALAAAQRLVENGLAGCVNVLPQITSVYHWDNAVQTETEYLLIIKTQKNRYSALEADIREHHPYELPEVIATPISHGSKDYLSWIESQIKGLT